jgi:enoyl-CoA hydratase/carnithine racemase
MNDESIGRPELRLERHEAVAWLIIDRPEHANSISRAMRTTMLDMATAIEADRDIRVVIVTGTGRTFCAGADLKEVAQEPLAHPLADPLPRISAALDGLTIPVIAAINGPAAGGGLELVLAADIRLASPKATFSLPEVRVGSLPGSGGTQRLFAAVPSATAWKMLLTGQAIDAEEALRVGLVSNVVPEEELHSAAESVAQLIVQNAPLSIRAAKIAGRAAQAHDGGSELALERALWALLATTDDRAEGRAAFRERRPTRFRGR